MQTSPSSSPSDAAAPDWTSLGADIMRRIFFATGDVACVASAASTCRAFRDAAAGDVFWSDLYARVLGDRQHAKAFVDQPDPRVMLTTTTVERNRGGARDANQPSVGAGAGASDSSACDTWRERFRRSHTCGAAWVRGECRTNPVKILTHHHVRVVGIDRDVVAVGTACGRALGYDANTGRLLFTASVTDVDTHTRVYGPGSDVALDDSLDVSTLTDRHLVDPDHSAVELLHVHGDYIAVGTMGGGVLVWLLEPRGRGDRVGASRGARKKRRGLGSEKEESGGKDDGNDTPLVARLVFADQPFRSMGRCVGILEQLSLIDATSTRWGQPGQPSVSLLVCRRHPDSSPQDHQEQDQVGPLEHATTATATDASHALYQPQLPEGATMPPYGNWGDPAKTVEVTLYSLAAVELPVGSVMRQVKIQGPWDTDFSAGLFAYLQSSSIERPEGVKGELLAVDDLLTGKRVATFGLGAALGVGVGQHERIKEVIMVDGCILMITAMNGDIEHGGKEEGERGDVGGGANRRGAEGRGDIDDVSGMVNDTEADIDEAAHTNNHAFAHRVLSLWGPMRRSECANDASTSILTRPLARCLVPGVGIWRVDLRQGNTLAGGYFYVMGRGIRCPTETCKSQHSKGIYTPAGTVVCKRSVVSEEEEMRDSRAGGPRVVWSALRVRCDGKGGFEWCPWGLKSSCHSRDPAVHPHGAVAFNAQQPGIHTATAVLIDRPGGYGCSPQVLAWTLPQGAESVPLRGVTVAVPEPDADIEEEEWTDVVLEPFGAVSWRYLAIVDFPPKLVSAASRLTVCDFLPMSGA